MFAKHYKHGLKSLVLTIWDMELESYTALMSCLIQMQALIDLKVVESHLDDDMMALMPQKLRDIALFVSNVFNGWQRGSLADL
ncbi:unnamed protein product, partial [Oppiella nova]